MAATAVGTEFTIVDVVGAMTVAATTVNGFDFCQGHAMTVVTTHLDMRAVEREVSLQVVIKSPDVPGNRVMAAVTSVFKIAFVRVVVLMAGDTVDRFVRIGLGGMTAVTFLLAMHAV